MGVKKKIIIVFLFVLMIIPGYRVSAKTLGDLKNELSSLERKYAEAKNNKDMTSEQISNLTSEINAITSRINETKNEIKNTENEIVAGEKIVTSNISDKYLPGILIGYVSTIEEDSNNLTKSGKITPVVQFEYMNEVLVIMELKSTGDK